MGVSRAASLSSGYVIGTYKSHLCEYNYVARGHYQYCLCVPTGGLFKSGHVHKTVVS